MKFLCIPCDAVMGFEERQLPGDGTLAAVFACPTCKREMAMLTNPMETRLVASLGVKIGGREVPEQPMETLRTSLADAREDAFVEASEQALEGVVSGGGESGWNGRVTWSADATDRLSKVPSFVRGMVKRIYTDYAKERAIPEITTEVMDRARTDLGLEGM
jgi:hypothetical protein